MSRKVQSQAARPSSGAKTVASLFANALFWLVLAIVLPVRHFLEAFPELVPFAPFAPLVLYGLALLSFVRGLLGLRRALPHRLAIGPQAPAAGERPGRPPAASKSGLPVNRTPTVQRMR